MTLARAVLPALIGGNVGNLLSAILFAAMGKLVSPWTVTWWALCATALIVDWIVVFRQQHP
jgi:hypothetical protein